METPWRFVIPTLVALGVTLVGSLIRVPGSASGLDPAGTGITVLFALLAAGLAIGDRWNRAARGRTVSPTA